MLLLKALNEAIRWEFLKIVGKNRRNKMNLVDKVSAKQLKSDIPEFRVGDTVRVDVKIIEGKKERIQAFEGIVTARKSGGVNETFTVRKVSYGVGVNRIFPVHSPKIANITVIKKGKVRRAKLNFLKDRVGVYRIKERGNKAA